MDGVLAADPVIRYTFLVLGDVDMEAARRHLSFVPPECELVHLPLPAGRSHRAQAVYRDWVALPRLLDRGGFDLFHGQYQTLPRCRRVPVVTTLHDLISFREKDWRPVTPAQMAYRRYCMRAYGRATAIISISHSTAADLHRVLRYPRSRSHVIHSGVDPMFFRPADPEARAALERERGIRPPYILYVGDLSPRKDVVTLVRAYARVRQEMPDAPPLVLSGKPWFIKMPELAEAERLGVADSVRHICDVSEVDLLALYKGASLFVFPSLWEGFGFPPLEAMASGVPVITSDVSSLPELVGDVGLRCEPRSDEQFAAAMLRLLRDPQDRAARAAAGIERAAQFTWERTGREVARVYRECVR